MFAYNLKYELEFLNFYKILQLFWLRNFVDINIIKFYQL